MKNVDFTVIESEIRDFFGQSGKVENIRMLRNASGRFIGTAFVVYSSTVRQVLWLFNSRLIACPGGGQCCIGIKQ